MTRTRHSKALRPGSGGKDRLDEFMARPTRAVWIVAAPMMVGFMVHAMYTIVDAAFIGSLSPYALAGATYIGAFIFFAIAFTNGLASGVTAALAQAIGRRDREMANKVATGGLAVGVLIGVLFSGGGLLFGEGLIHLMGARGETADLAWQYMFPMCAGMPLFFISTAIRAVMNGEGDAKTPTIILGISTLTNIGLDPLFIFGLDLGIQGAAYATIASHAVATGALAFFTFVKGRTLSKIGLKHLAFTGQVFKPIVVVGAPATVSHIIMALGMGLVNRVLSEFGQIAVTGYGAGTKVDMIVVLPVLGLAAASVTVVGMFAGAGRADLVRKVAFYAYKWALLLATFIGIAAVLASEVLIAMFTDDPTASAIGEEYIRFTVFAYPFMAFGMTSGRILQGLGFGMPTLVITALRVLLIGVGGAAVSVYLFAAPIESVWISFIAGGVIADGLALYWVRKYVWKSDPCAFAVKR